MEEVEEGWKRWRRRDLCFNVPVKDLVVMNMLERKAELHKPVQYLHQEWKEGMSSDYRHTVVPSPPGTGALSGC